MIHNALVEKMTRVSETPTFELTHRPWIPAQFLDGSEREVSLIGVFHEARRIRRLAAEMPTQEFALLRLLVAITHDALRGPKDFETWEELWHSPSPFAPVPGYLCAYRERFDLLHPSTPFFQVASLRTAKGDIASLNRIVADVPNGDPFFTMRFPGVDRLGFAEAARWLVHAHAFDPSGIKSGAIDDPRVKSGKGYPQGVAWAGNLGGVMVEADTLHETLLLHLIAAGTAGQHHDPRDRPAWRASVPSGPDAAFDLVERPYGVRDLYTWQSRRVRLHFDAEGVYGVVHAYGDPLEPHNRHKAEPMSGWRRSRTQEAKRGEPLVYMPREHDPVHRAWRGLTGLLVGARRTTPPQERPEYLRPGLIDWISRLSTHGALPPKRLIGVRIVGAWYGTQQSVIDGTVDDRVVIPAVLLHEGGEQFRRTVIGALSDMDTAVAALGHLAADLAHASGSRRAPVQAAAQDLGFDALDAPLRNWLREIGESSDPCEHRRRWAHRLCALVTELAEDLLTNRGFNVRQGRDHESHNGPSPRDDTAAEERFRTVLQRVLALRA